MPNANKAKTKSALSLIALTLVVTISVFLLGLGNGSSPKVSFANAKVNVEIAERAIDRKVGLGNHDSLGRDDGMLFLFDVTSVHGFWMESMDFAIDIMWLDEARRVVHLETNVAPETYPEVFYPNLPAKYVLETNAGWAQAHNVRVGDIAHFDL